MLKVFANFAACFRVTVKKSFDENARALPLRVLHQDWKKTVPTNERGQPHAGRSVLDCESASNIGFDAISMIFTTAQVAPINLA
jgi:hypothetical protein